MVIKFYGTWHVKRVWFWFYSILLFVVCIVLLANNRPVDHLENCCFCSDFQYGFRSSWSTVDLMTVIFERITEFFVKSKAIRAMPLPMLLSWCGMLVFFTYLKHMEFLVRYLSCFVFFLVIDWFEWFWVRNLSNSIRLMLQFLNAPF